LKIENRKSPILVIGVGNDYRRDDAIGLVVARRVKALGLKNVIVIEDAGEGAHLIESWNEAETVIVVDAVSSGSAAGTIHRFDATAQTFPSKIFRYSSHAFNVADAIELARSLNRLPQVLVVYGIEGRRFDAGMGLSPEVDQAVEEVLSRIMGEKGIVPNEWS
jgi:hydrogenase maturation protease